MVLPWEQLRLVLAIARHGTLTGAARALGMAPEALDAELKAVERAAGAALFVREEGQILPTDAGRGALRTGERMAEEMARVDRVLPPVSPGPPVRVGMEAMLAARWLQSSGADLGRWLGPVTLELVTARAGKRSPVDLEVSARRPAARRASARSLGVVGEALYASEGYLLEHGRPERSDRLVGHRIVLLSGMAARSDAGRWLQQAARSGAEVALRTDGVASMLAAVGASVGLGVLPCGSEDAVPELVRVAELPEIPIRPLWLVAGGRLSARVRRAAEVLERSLGAALRRWERG